MQLHSYWDNGIMYAPIEIKGGFVMNEIMNQQSQLVVKHNDLIQKSKYNLTITQQKLIAYIISLIKPTDKELKKYEVSVSDFCQLCGIDKRYFYTDFKDLIDDLDNKAFWIETDEKIFKFRWFLKAEYMKKQGKVLLLLDDDVKKYLIDLKEKFTVYELYNILALKSKYSVRLYELFKSYAFQKEKVFLIDEFKELLLATNYNNFKDFRNRVLEKAIDEINFYTDLDVSYETITKGRKVIAVKIYIKKKEMAENLQAYRNTIAEINKRNNQISGQISMFDKYIEVLKDE
jgi:plasmid replication initiation protein